MLVDSLKWRKEFKADELVTESFDVDLFGSLGYLHGKDKAGRPVCYNFYGDIDQDKVFKDIQTFIRWRLQLMEQSVQLVDLVNVDSMIQVHDYLGASMFGRSANAKAATSEIIKILQDNYPEFLATKFFVNVPWWGSKVFSLIRPLLPEATVKKFVVCSNGELLNTLEKSIDKDQLPKVYTGGAKFKAGSVTAAINASRQQEAKTTEAKSTEAKSTEAKSTEATTAEATTTEATTTEAKPTEATTTEAKPTEEKATESTTTEEKATETKPSEAAETSTPDAAS
ncbi:unnamed protein product [Absidia cylindrospora]